jgi:hypothetical protein
VPQGWCSNSILVYNSITTIVLYNNSNFLTVYFRGTVTFQCSYVMIYLMQIGLELISNSSNEDVLVIMLFSLSKLASICTLLTSNHVSAFFIIL